MLRLRAAGCVFAEEEAALLVAAVGGGGGGDGRGGGSGRGGVTERLEAMVVRRVAGEPLEYVLGWAEFRGLRIAVAAPVFVPRRRTELLAEEAVARARQWPAPVVVELCCGAAAISAVVLSDLAGDLLPSAGSGSWSAVGRGGRGVELYAADIDEAAVRCARVNLGGRATVLHGDLYDALPEQLRGRVAVIAANAPYVPTGAIRTMPPEARLFEAHVALDGGADGLDVHRRLAQDAADWLAPGGCLIVEASERQAPVTADIFERCGLAASIRSSDDLDATIVIGTAP